VLNHLNHAVLAIYVCTAKYTEAIFLSEM